MVYPETEHRPLRFGFETNASRLCLSKYLHAQPLWQYLPGYCKQSLAFCHGLPTLQAGLCTVESGLLSQSSMTLQHSHLRHCQSSPRTVKQPGYTATCML